MIPPVRILLVEDLPTDAELNAREVRSVLQSCEFKRVESREDYFAALSSFKPDVILCDYKLPQFDGLSALAHARKSIPDTPFIIVTGSMNEDTAVESMKAGAWDYVIKEHLQRLGPAVVNAMKQSQLRIEQKAAKKKAELWENVFAKAQFGLAYIDAVANTFIDVNPTFAREHGYSHAELLGMSVMEMFEPEHWEEARHWEEVAEAEGHAVFESIHRRKDGTSFPVLMEVAAHNTKKGQPRTVVWFSLDITPLKMAQKHRDEEYHRRKLLVEQSHDGIVVVDEHGHAVETNKRFADMLGYSPEEILQLSIADWDVYLTPEQVEEKLRFVDETGDFFETRHRHKDGSLIDVEISSNGAVFNGRKLIFCICRDISGRKRAEEELRDSELLFRNLFHFHSAIKLTIDPDTGAILDANQAAVTFYGWSRETLMQMSINQINMLPAEKLKMEIEKVRTSRRTRFEFRHRRADGSIRDVEVFSSKIEVKGKDILHSIIHDITDRKEAEAALRASQAEVAKAKGLLSDTQRLTKLGGWEYDVFRKKLTWTDEVFHIHELPLNFDPNDIETDIGFYAPADQKKISEAFFALVEKGEPYDLTLQLISAQGTLKWVRTMGQAERRDEKIVRAYGNIMDISEQRHLYAERDLLSAAIDQVNEAIVITDPDGIILYVNPAFETITGFSPRESLGKNPQFLKSGQHDQAFYKNLWETITGGKTWKGRFINKRKNDGLYTEASTISPIMDHAHHITHYIAVKRDITDNLKLEAQFQQAQKMESVGRLAGGVAHDFNNILSVIMGYSELALMRLEDHSDPIYADICEVLKAAERTRNIIRQLLAFARKQTVSPEVLDLNATVESMLKILRRLIGEEIDLIWKPGGQLWPVNIDPSQIDQILANLCVNARDAIEGVGHLSIQTECVSMDEAECLDMPGCVPGEYVLLSVRDDGAGMPPEILEKIFEPFFTTKEVGKGTGLGLATVYGIVKQNNGFIQAISEVGQGTTFQIYLPRSKEPLTATDSLSETEAPRGRQEVILLVEDDNSILKLAQRLLERLGYQVLSARKPSEALTIANDHLEEIQLLLTDVVMPEMNGRELADKLLSVKSDLKCLFMSGYSPDFIAHRGVLDKDLNLLNKPFTSSSLANAVRNLLDS